MSCAKKRSALPLALITTVVVGVSARGSSPVHAQSAETLAAVEGEVDSDGDGVAEPPEAIELEERDVPDFDGRGDDPMTAGEALAWIPRVLLSPLYFVTEFVLRRPLSFVVTHAEESQLRDQVVNFFHFGPGQRFVLAPTFSFETGFRPTGGFHFAVEDAVVEGNKFYLTFGFGGPDYLSASMGDRYEHGAWEAGLLGNFSTRADGRFYGIGSEISEKSSRYDWLGVDAEAYVTYDVHHQGLISLAAGIRHRDFGNDVGGRDDNGNGFADRSVQDGVEAGRYAALPPGFEGFTTQYTALTLHLDSRPVRPGSQTGVRLTVQSEIGVDLDAGATERSWVKYGAGLTGFWDVSGVNHVLSLSIGLGVIDEIHGEVPFTELLSLSGTGPMSGFITGFLLGESEIVASFEYDWPIWMWLAGTAHVAVGNNYTGFYDDFDLERLRMSAGVGLAAIAERDHFFELLVGFGTDEFEDGPDVESVRVVLGARREF